MEFENKQQEGRDADILFSRTVKAGQRVYYIDVKRNRKGEMYLCLTESKRTYSGPQDMPQVSFEKHKIFLFPEDFAKFSDAMREAVEFALSDGTEERREEGEAIKLDIDF